MLGEMAAIDNDFLCHLMETDLTKAGYQQESLHDFISEFLRQISPEVVMHCVVYENELMYSSNSQTLRTAAKQLFDEGVIRKYDWNEIFPDAVREKYYEMVLEDLYESWKGEPFPVVNWKQDWQRKSSLGETHTIAMCVMIGCRIFLSDDKGAAALAGILDQKLADGIQVCGIDTAADGQVSLKVYNRAESLREISFGNKKLRRALGHTRV